MTEDELLLKEYISKIKVLDKTSMEKAKDYQATLAMPPGSLGVLQHLAVKLCGIFKTLNPSVNKKRIIVLCSDNGVVSQGVSSAPQSVTSLQAVNMTKGLTGMSCLAKHFCNDVQVVDVGIKTEYCCKEIINKKIRYGTDDISLSSAMKREEAVKAILLGIELAYQAYKDGYKIIGVGEMGIGNTTTSTAVLSLLENIAPENITGRGGCISDEMLLHKKEIILKAISCNKDKIKNINGNIDVVDVISCVGGLDIAAMCGVFLGCAVYRIPVVIDGYISIVAALCAYKLAPLSKDYFIASHVSKEPGYLIASKSLNVTPLFDLKMRLGEGCGCPLAFQIVESACVIMNDMATFSKAKIDDSYLNNIRKTKGTL